MCYTYLESEVRPMTKGERIKQLRITKGISQSELAKFLNTTKQTISKYENGIVTNIPSDKVEAMATLFGTTPQYILAWEEIHKKNDALSDIIIELRTDEDFMSIVEAIYKMDKDKRSSLLAFLK
jgi:transcriptional regulator with XRE-family HTH domain